MDSVNKLKYPFTLLLTAILLYANTLGHGFVWDDNILFTNREIYTNFDLQRIFFSLANGVEYLPIRDLSLAIDFAIWGINPFGAHLTNLLLFALNALAVYALARKITLAIKLYPVAEQDGLSHRTAFITALIFILHPIHSEVVSFVTCRNVLLSGLFSFLSLTCYLAFLEKKEKSSSGYYLLSLLFLLLALLSKATAVTVPLVIIYFALSRSGDRRKYIQLTPFFLAMLLFSLLYYVTGTKSGVISGQLSSYSSGYLQEKIAVALQIPFFYLWKLLLPIDLTIYYDLALAKKLTDIRSITAAIAILTVLIVAFRLRSRKPALLVSISCYFLLLLPVLNLLPTNPVVADRYLYLPSFPFCFLLATLLLTQTAKRALSYAVIAIICCIGSWWGVVTARQNMVWKSDLTLFSHAVAKAPGASRPLVDLGRVCFFKEGNYPRALDSFQKAAAIDPAEPHYDYFQGLMALRLRNDPDTALYFYKRALARDPLFIEALYYAGEIYEATGRIAEARQLYQQAVQSHRFDISNLKVKAKQGIARLDKRD